VAGIVWKAFDEEDNTKIVKKAAVAEDLMVEDLMME